MAQRSAGFGSRLRQARIRKGLDINEVARRLRIRPDVLQTIEAGDLQHMPPRGYARNMINSYAHFLGLNPTEITRMYLDEQHEFQAGRGQQNLRQSGFDMSEADRRRPGATMRNRAVRSDPRNGNVDSFGRRRYDDAYPEPNSRGMGTGMGAGYVAPSARRSRVPSGEGSESPLNVYSGPKKSFDFRDHIPMILVGAVVALLLIILVALIFGPKTQPEPSVSKMPVTGLSSTSSSSSSSSVVTEVAPTKSVFEYTVASGSQAYIEIYVDETLQESGTVNGPSTKSYDVTGSFQFVCSGTDGVTAKQDGVEVALEPDSDGLATVDINFPEVLAAWQAAHPSSSTKSSSSTAVSSVKSSSSSAAASTTAASARTTTSSATSTAN